VDGEHFAELHDESGLDALEVEAVIDRGMSARDDAEVFFRRRAAHGDGDAEMRVKVEPGFVFRLKIEVGMVGAAGGFRGVRVVMAPFLVLAFFGVHVGFSPCQAWEKEVKK